MLIMYKSSFLTFVLLLGTFVHATAQNGTAQAIDRRGQPTTDVVMEVVYRQTPMAFEKLNLPTFNEQSWQDIP